MYCDLFAGAVLDGLQQEAISHGKDIGEAEELPAEALPTPGEEAGQAANA
jgi:small subunit ribosomal protein S2